MNNCKKYLKNKQSHVLEYYPNYSDLLGWNILSQPVRFSFGICPITHTTGSVFCVPTEENSNTHLRCILQINQTYNKHSKEGKVVTITRDKISVIPCVATSLGVSYPITLHWDKTLLEMLLATFNIHTSYFIIPYHTWQCLWVLQDRETCLTSQLKMPDTVIHTYRIFQPKSDRYRFISQISYCVIHQCSSYDATSYPDAAIAGAPWWLRQKYRRIEHHEQ